MSKKETFEQRSGVLTAVPVRVPLKALDMALDDVAYENIDIAKVLSRDSEQSRSARNIISKYIGLVSSYAQWSASKHKLASLATVPTTDDETHAFGVVKPSVTQLEVPEYAQELAIKELLPEYYYRSHYDDNEQAISSDDSLFLVDLKDNVGNAQGLVHMFALALNSDNSHEETLKLVQNTQALQGKLWRLKEELSSQEL